MKNMKTVSRWTAIAAFAAIGIAGSAGMAGASILGPNQTPAPAPKPKPALVINNVNAQGETAINSTKICETHIDAHGNSYRADVKVPYRMDTCVTANGTNYSVNGTFEIQMPVGVAKGTVTGTAVENAKHNQLAYDLQWHVTGGTANWTKATGDVHVTGTGNLFSPHANQIRLADTLKLAGTVQS